MSTYDPKSVQITIGGVPFDGFTSVKYDDTAPPMRAGADGTSLARVAPAFIEYPVADGADICAGDALMIDDEGRIVRATPSVSPRGFAGFAAADASDGRVRVQVAGRIRIPARPRGITADELRARFAVLSAQDPLPLP